MAQVRKEEVQQRIERAALAVFAERGYPAASMGEIAARARISAGNIYRYYPGKEELFRAVVPERFVRELGSLLRRRVRALRGVRELGELPADAPYHLISEELLALGIEHRLRVVLLLGRAQGTPHQGFAERLVEELVKLALAHARASRPGRAAPPTARFVLREIYRGLVRVLVEILTTYAEEAQIRDAVARFSGYHLTGLRALLDGLPDSRTEVLA